MQVASYNMRYGFTQRDGERHSLQLKITFLIKLTTQYVHVLTAANIKLNMLHMHMHVLKSKINDK